MAAEWSLSPAQKSLLATAIFIGMLAGALFWGRLSDRIGRKAGFLATVGIDSLFGLLSAFAPSFGILLVLRTLTGFGVGGTLPVDYGMFAEYLPSKDRGRRLVLLESFWALGTLVAAGVSWLVVPTLGWRWLFVISALPGLVLYLIRRYVPESPRFLLAQGKRTQAWEVLRHVARENGMEPSRLEVLEREDSQAQPVAAQPAQPPSVVRSLFEPRFARTTILLWLIWFLISLGYYGAFTWLPSWFRTKGFSLLAVYPNTFVMALAQLPGYFSAAWLVEKLGRRWTLAIYLCASGVFAWLFALAQSPAAVLATAVWLSFFALGAWGALYAYTPEAYPTSLRTTGMGAASGWTRIAGAIAPSIGAAVTGNSLALPLAIFALAYILAAGSSLLLPYETRGLSLEDA
jgi:putative MFS transporter